MSRHWKSYISLMLEEHNVSKEILVDSIECGKFVLAKCPKLFVFLPDDMKYELFDEAIDVDYKLINSYKKLCHDKIFRALKKYPKAILHLYDLTEEMLRYAFSLDPSLASIINCTNLSDELISVIAEYCPDKRIFLRNLSEEDQFYFVTKDLNNIVFIANPCKEVCFYVLERNPDLFFQKNNSIDVSKYIFEYDIKLFPYLNYHTKDMINKVMEECPHLAVHSKMPICQEFCDNMLDQYGEFIKRINNPTEEQCFRAFETFRKAIIYMTNPPHEMIIKAIDDEPKIFYDLKTFSEEVVWYIILNHSEILNVSSNFIKNHEALSFTDEQLTYLVHNNPHALSFINYIPENIINLLIDIYKGDAIKYMMNPSSEAIKILLNHDISNIKYLCTFRHSDIIMHSLLKDPHLIRYFRIPSKIMRYMALLLDPTTIKYIKSDSKTSAVIRGEEIHCKFYRQAVEFIENFS